jgi:hypothetical protein
MHGLWMEPWQKSKHTKAIERLSLHLNTSHMVAGELAVLERGGENGLYPRSCSA